MICLAQLVADLMFQWRLRVLYRNLYRQRNYFADHLHVEVIEIYRQVKTIFETCSKDVHHNEGDVH